MSKKERLAAFNRENILSAAKRLFLEKGVAQTTMDEISKEADYSKATVYAYFKSKDEICTYIKLENFEILKTTVSKAINDSPGFPDGYYAVCDALMKFYDAYPLFFESVLGEIELPGDEAYTVLVQLYKVGEDINEVMGNYFEKYVAEKHICLDMPLKQMTFVLWAGIAGTITMAHKKEAYINLAMGISKEDFMQEGFRLLLKSIKK